MDRRPARTKITVHVEPQLRVEFTSPHTLEEIDAIYKNTPRDGVVKWDIANERGEFERAHTAIEKRKFINYTVFEISLSDITLVRNIPGVKDTGQRRSD